MLVFVLFIDLSATTLVPVPNLTLETQNINIFCMTLVSQNTIIFSDGVNVKLILIDKDIGSELSAVTLPECPRVICKIDNKRVVATTSEKSVRFISLNDNALCIDTAFNIDVDIFGIAGLANDFVISHESPAGVSIISNEGRQIHTTDNVIAGRHVFKNPRRIATPPDDTIYVTDRGTHEIIRFDASLKILQTFSGDTLRYPVGIIYINTDQLLVCSRNTDNIILIRPSTNSMTVLLDKQHGIYRPTSLGFCKEEKKLFIASHGTINSVLAFKLT